MDALLTQQGVAQAIVDRGGHYLMVVKANQPGLERGSVRSLKRASGFEGPIESERVGRRPRENRDRKLSTSTALAGYEGWPGLEQVMKIERTVIQKKSGQQSTEKCLCNNELDEKTSRVEELLKMLRGHWHIENKSHWVRDVTYDEDRFTGQTRQHPPGNGGNEKWGYWVDALSGESNIAAACRKFAAQPWSALALIGINPQN